MDQRPVAARLAGIQRLFKRIEYEVGAHRPTHPPANDAPRKHVDDERHLQPALPRRNVGEIGNPKLIRPVGRKLAIDPVQRARCRDIWNRRANPFAANRALQSQPLHQSLDRAAGHTNLLPVHLPPDLVCAVDPHVGVPDTLDFRAQHVITLDSGAALRWIGKLGSMAPVTRRGNPQDLADRLDPEGVAMLIDEGFQDLIRRSSSAWAKNALASLRISLVLRNSLFSRSSVFRRSRSLVVRPARSPLSISSRLTQSFSVCGVQPIIGAIDSTAAHSEGCSLRRAPGALRAPGLPGKTCSISCSWLHFLKSWSLLQIRGDSHNFEQLKAHILPLSEAKDFSIARAEWELVGVEISDEFDHCPCGKEIKEHCYIKNKINGNSTYVGNVCINRFIGIDTGSLFDGLKRIASDDSANANRDLIIHAYKLGYIYEGEFKFLMEARLKRKLSDKQIAWKQKINRRIINQTVVHRRGQQNQ